jgi:hypothetical protein
MRDLPDPSEHAEPAAQPAEGTGFPRTRRRRALSCIGDRPGRWDMNMGRPGTGLPRGTPRSWDQPGWWGEVQDEAEGEEAEEAEEEGEAGEERAHRARPQSRALRSSERSHLPRLCQSVLRPQLFSSTRRGLSKPSPKSSIAPHVRDSTRHTDDYRYRRITASSHAHFRACVKRVRKGETGSDTSILTHASRTLLWVGCRLGGYLPQAS